MNREILSLDLCNKIQRYKHFFRIMKITFLFLFVLIFCLHAETTNSQNIRVTIKRSNVELRDVLNNIEEQTDYLFVYDKYVDVNHKVSVNSDKRPLEEVLGELFAKTDIKYAVDGTYIVLSSKDKIVEKTQIQKVTQQKRTITGVVKDIHEEPVIGANVVEKGTTNGTITDIDGKFSLSVSENSTLLVSYIGYANQEVKVGNQTSYTIVLKEDQQVLDEVVVVGYGSVKKANLTGAVGYIDNKELENRTVSTLTQAIQGKVAGVNISTSNGQLGQNQSLNLRGYTGINIDANGNRSNRADGPLIVIDGVQGGDLSTLEMNDVESISFLKDAASAAIYGSSAPYGVVIVTTKKGQTGKPVISYNNNFGFSQPINLPNFMSSLDYAYAWNEASENSNMAPMFSETTIQRIKDYQAGLITDGTTKNATVDEWNTYNNANANTDWFDVLFKNASFSQQHNVNFSGATESSSYFASVGYMQQDGMYKYGDEVQRRYNVRLNFSSNLTKWLTVGMRSAFSRSDLDVPMAADSWNFVHLIGRNFPTNPIKNPDGDYSQPSYIKSLSEGGRRRTISDNAILTGELNIRPLSGWDITANYTYNGTYVNVKEHGKNYSLLRPSGKQDLVNAFSSFNRRMNKNQQYTINAFTSYEKTLDSGHYFKAMLGYTQELTDLLQFTGSAERLYTDEVPMLGLSYGTRDVGDDASQLAIRGAFGRINYNYKEKYLIELNGRYDGTSRFMKDVRFKFYPGVSGAWVVSKEDFWEPVQDYMNQLKIRASYASLGDQSFTDSYYPFYPGLGVYAPTGANYYFNDGRQSLISNPGFVNYDLTWVTVNTLSFGVDMAMFNNRLDFSFDWYNRKAKDFADFGASLPALLGATPPRRNSAETETKGFELTLGWKDRINDFSYGATFVLSDYIGKIVKYDNPDKLLNNLWYDGMTMGEIWGYETEGLFKDEAEIATTDQSYLNANWYPGDVHYKDLNGDGKVDIGKNTVEDPGDRKVIGNNTPRFSFGLTLNAEWKGFDASIFFQGVGKRDYMFDPEANYFWGFVNGEWNSSYFTEHADRWTPDNPNGYFPRIYFNTAKNRQAQTRYLQNAAYLRIKNLQLGYTLPKTITSKINFQKARLFVNIENLATLTGLTNIVDPEIISPDAKTYPLRRTWAFGVNVTF